MRRDGSCQLPKGSFDLKVGLADMLKGGVIIEVTNSEQAKIAEDSGAVAVIVIERMPADIIAQGGVARMSNPEHIQSIQEAVSIPIIAKCRIGHVVEAQILEALFVDYIDESEVLTAADDHYHLDKHPFRIPFVCGYSNLTEALRRISEGAAMVRTKGGAGTGNIADAVRSLRQLNSEIRKLTVMTQLELYDEAIRLQAPIELIQKVAKTGVLPVPNFAAGGVTTPADAALMIYLGAQSIFVGSGIFKSKDPLHQAKAMVAAISFYNDPEMLADISKGLLDTMKDSLKREEILAQRGW